MAAIDVTLLICHAAGDPDWPAGEVERLARVLRDDGGAEVLLDQWVEDSRDGQLSDDEWQDWMVNAVENVDRIVCLGSRFFTSRFDARGPAGGGRGVALEAQRIRRSLYNALQRNAGRVLLYSVRGAKPPLHLDGQCPQFEAPRQEKELVRKACSTTGIVALKRWRAAQMHMLASKLSKRYAPVSAKLHDRIAPALRDDYEQELLRLGKGPAIEQGVGDADVLDAIQVDSRVLLVGEPGAGKTFVLLRVLERDLEDGGLAALVDLMHWRDAAVDFEPFVRQQLSEGGSALFEAVLDGRCRLLLDNLESLSAPHADAARAQIAAWLHRHGNCSVLIATRPGAASSAAAAFSLDRFELLPLRPRQVLAMLRCYFGKHTDVAKHAEAEQLFWRIAGGEAVRLGWLELGAGTDDARLDDYVEGRAAPWLSGLPLAAWQAACSDPERVYDLATRPFTLYLLAFLQGEEGERDKWIRLLAGMSLRNEARRHGEAADIDRIEGIEGQLATLAEHRQLLNVPAGHDLPAAEFADAVVPGIVDPGVLDLALGARLLCGGPNAPRFRYPWLQDFYLRLGLRHRLQDEVARRLRPTAAPGRAATPAEPELPPAWSRSIAVQPAAAPAGASWAGSIVNPRDGTSAQAGAAST